MLEVNKKETEAFVCIANLHLLSDLPTHFWRCLGGYEVPNACKIHESFSKYYHLTMSLFKSSTLIGVFFSMLTTTTRRFSTTTPSLYRTTTSLNWIVAKRGMDRSYAPKPPSGTSSNITTDIGMSWIQISQ